MTNDDDISPSDLFSCVGNEDDQPGFNPNKNNELHRISPDARKRIQIQIKKDHDELKAQFHKDRGALEAKMEHDSASPAETVANIEELLTEILLRVPAETLTRFKRVSKHWLSLISTPSFRESHAKCVHNKTLYICTFEEHDHQFKRYRVQAIKYSDLFSFSDTPITIYCSKSKSKSKSNVLQEVAFIGGNDCSVSWGMGFGVFCYQFVLAGGWDSYAAKPFDVLETDPEARFVPSMIPVTEEYKSVYHPFLHEIDGKLYVLSTDQFAVFDPKNKVCAPLPPLPVWDSFDSCSASGSKIFATLTDTENHRSNTFFFDVASPHRSWTRIEPSLLYYGREFHSKQALVLDSEDDFEKLMFTSRYGRILVHRILLSNADEPNKIELAASIDLPELPSLSECGVVSYCCAHLGDRKVCFSFLFWKPVAPNYTRFVLVLTLEFAYYSSASSRPDISSSSTSDPNSLSYTSISGSFSAKALGCHLFEYNYGEESSVLRCTRFGGCFVL